MTRQIDEHATGQLYALGLNDDRPGAAERELGTVGVRYFRKPRGGHLYGEFEGAYQFGQRNNQDVAAFFFHTSLGYRCDCAMQPTVRVAIDFATGDRSDDDYNRFDTLFGARRFEYGPTGIYGAIGRRNIISPEVRVSLKPTPSTWVLFAWRDLRLESGSDDWVEARDGTGQGRSIGQQVECRLRWDPCAKNMRFEMGGAYFAGGRFRETSTSGRSSDTRYFFFETIFTF